MGYAVLGAWLIQAGVGVSLLVNWARHGLRAAAGALSVHAVLMLVWVALWASFIVSADARWAWLAVIALCVGIPFGEVMMVRRARRIRQIAVPRAADYGTAITTVFAGRMPPRVTFHALFSAAVFFGSLGVAIAATVSAS